MNYLALGDSISIDKYTGVTNGGAVSQFSRLIAATSIQDFTCDGRTTQGVLDSLHGISARPHVVSLTAGGNDFLLAALWTAEHSNEESWKEMVERPLENLNRIADALVRYECPVIMNTIYDPTDGQDALAGSMGISPYHRSAFEALNGGIRVVARKHGFLLGELTELFRGHGIGSAEPWIVQEIEPNYAGATAIATHWFQLYQSVYQRAAS